MTPSEVTSKARAWPRLGWWVAVLLVMLAQLVFIFSLGSRSTTPPRKTVSAPTIHLSEGGQTELLALTDPTLFVLPHHEAVSGRAWLQIPSLTVPPFEWAEPEEWLPLKTSDLGNAFKQFVQTNRMAGPRFEILPEAQLTAPDDIPTESLITKSTLRLEGALKERRLLRPPDLTAMTTTNLLANSIVQVIVDSLGNTLSAVLLSPGSGSTNMDSQALQIAKSLHFAPRSRAQPPRPGNDAHVTVGTIIFNWQMVPTETNGSGASP